jgi:ATP-dependent Clp protease ATP-binding subunit ClpA
MLAHFSEDLYRAVTSAFKEATALGHGAVEAGHIVLALLSDENGPLVEIVQSCGADVQDAKECIKQQLKSAEQVNDAEVRLSEKTKELLLVARHEAQSKGLDRIRVEDFLAALVSDTDAPSVVALESIAVTSSQIRRSARATPPSPEATIDDDDDEGSQK